MSESILERLEARLSAKPAIISIETLFSDLLEARDEIKILKEKLDIATNAVVPPAEAAVEGAYDRVGYAAHIAPDTVAHAHQLLVDAEERLSVNAIGTVSTFITRARKLLSGET